VKELIEVYYKFVELISVKTVYRFKQGNEVGIITGTIQKTQSRNPRYFQ
jgi:hypothetical protein